MFSNSTIILSFFKNTISVYEVKFKNGKGEIKEKGQTAWKEETLTPIFKSLKEIREQIPNTASGKKNLSETIVSYSIRTNTAFGLKQNAGNCPRSC